jgi:hypothetical protein
VVLKLGLAWLASYLLLDVGAFGGETTAIPLLLVNSVLTSSYFVLNLWLMLKLWQGKTVHLPLLGRVSRLP